MTKRTPGAAWSRLLGRSLEAMTRDALRAGRRATGQAIAATAERRAPPSGSGDWIAGTVIGATGACRYRLYRPAGVAAGETLPLIVMLHGCQQDAKAFATSTRMNRIAARERFLVLYPEQDRLANPQRCWNWFDVDTGRADREAGLIVKAVDQVVTLYRADRERVAIAGLSAGASMAALVATRFPARFRAVVMHSGIPPGAARSRAGAVGAMHGHRVPMPLAKVPRAQISTWPPLLVIHGARDAVVSSRNAAAAATLWADALGAHPATPRTLQRGRRHPMTVTDYRRGGEAVATRVEIAKLGHAWSGGLASQPFGDPQGPDASRMVWSFAARSFRRVVPVPTAR